MNLLSVSGIHKRSENGFVLKDISFSQQRFQKMVIAGETGSGKSTLMKIIAGLMQPHSGDVLFENERVLGPEEKLIPGHPEIAYLSQSFDLRNNYRVAEVLEMATQVPDKEAQKIFEVCRISHLLQRRNSQLSGGEKQRIAAARLLINSPKLLLLDEPYSNLDMVHKSILKSVIDDISGRLKISCIMISHDPSDILPWADKIIVMKDGEIIQKGTPVHIYHHPLNKYVAGLFGTYNVITADLAKNLGVSVEPNRVGKQIFTRPENFQIVQDERQGFPGKVTRINFFGSFYEIQVLVNGSMITARTQENNLANGDVIYLALNLRQVWYV